jgi:hypothetical protein
LAAIIFDLCASRPAVLWLPSLRISTGVPPSCPAIQLPPILVLSKRFTRYLNFYINVVHARAVEVMSI